MNGTELLLACVVGVALVGALLSTRGGERSRARRATSTALLLAGLSAALLSSDGGSSGALAAWIALDDLGRVGVALGAVVTLAAVIGSPRAELEPSDLPAVLFKFVSVVLAATARDGRVLAAACALGALPLLREDRAKVAEHGRGRALVPVVGSALVAVALLWLPASFEEVTNHPSPAATALLWTGLAIRLGILPFHSWVPAVFERGRPGTAVMVFAANPAPFVLARVGLPLDAAHAAGSAVFAVLAVVTTVYAAFLTIAQKDLLRACGWIAVMHTGFVALGLTSLERVGTTGALVHWVSAALSVTGLTLTAWSVHARTGTTSLARLGGIGEGRPLLSTAYLLSALACAGFPGTLGFFSEDLILHGALEHRPVAGGFLALATALAAIGLVRLYLRAFTGPGRTSTPLSDLVWRERLAAGLLLLLAFGLGVHPRPLAAACRRAVEASRALAPSGAL